MSKLEKNNRNEKTHSASTNNSDESSNCDVDYDHRECIIAPGTILDGKYTVISQLGQGGFCNVYLTSSNRGNVAVKVFKGGHNNRDCFDDEVKILTALSKASLENPDSNYIMKIFEIFAYLQYDFNHGHSSIHPCMTVTLYGGSIADIVDEFEGIPIESTKKIFRQILHGLRFIHSNGIVHGDLSSSNIMITESMDEFIKTKNFNNIQIGITDFNLSKFITDDFVGCAGTQEYCAPEVLLKMNYGPSADIWSAGCIFYEMLTGCHLFNIEEEEESYSEESENEVQHAAQSNSLRTESYSDSSRESTGGFSYSKNYTHLSGMVQLLGKPPRRFIKGCGERYFNSKGCLKHNAEIELFDLQKHLMSEFNFNKKASTEICTYLFKMIAYQSESRLSADELSKNGWLIN